MRKIKEEGERKIEKKKKERRKEGRKKGSKSLLAQGGVCSSIQSEIYNTTHAML